MDVAAKKIIRWRRAKKKNRNWKKLDFVYTTERHILERVKIKMKLALKQKMLELLEKTWSRIKIKKELHTICFKLTKKTLKLHKSISKLAKALIV